MSYYLAIRLRETILVRTVAGRFLGEGDGSLMVRAGTHPRPNHMCQLSLGSINVRSASGSRYR